MPTTDVAATTARPVAQRTQQVERVMIPALALALWVALPASWTWDPELRWVFGYAAVVILGQGLLRDVARLMLRRGPKPEATKLACLCAESSLGLTLLLLGAGGLTLLGVTQTVHLTPLRLSLTLLGLLTVGYVAKDYVLVLKRVEDHASIRPW